jgi:SWIM zinc finger
VAERWDRERVLALAPDAPSQRAAQSLASGRGAWAADGAAAGPGVLWGECRGGAATPYRTVIDLSGPAYRCSCPSRKFPCKHVLALLLRWADGAVQHDDAAGAPGWAATWLAARATRAGRPPPGQAGKPKDPEAAARRAAVREARVASGLAELDRWLGDQARQGLAASQQAGYGHWDDIAARMIDAQAPGLAERLRALAAVPHSGAGWEGRLLEEYALLHLLAVACQRQAGLPPPLRETVRSRVGFALRQADVLAAGPPVRDQWRVLARRDLEQDRIRVRRTWLRGGQTGRDALVLSFAPAGQGLDDSLAVGAEADADLVFYPGAVPLRAVVLARYGPAAGGADGPAAGGADGPAAGRADGPAAGGTDGPAAGGTDDGAGHGGPPAGGTIAGLLACYAAALAADPWLDRWPAVLDVTPARAPVPAVRDPDGDAAPLHPAAGDCWPLFALSGGRPVTVAGEWTPRGLWPLTAWDEGGRAVRL